MAFLNETGLERLWAHILARLGNKVDKVSGKGLSTNDYTDEDKESISTLNTLVGDISVAEQINTAVDTKLDKIDYLGPVIKEGSSVSYDNCIESSLIDVETTFSPIQEGSGEPSPDNIRKITGYNGLSLNQTSQDGMTVYSSPFGNVKYGGKLNWNTGILTVEWELLTLTGSSEEFSNWSYETIDGVQSSRFELNKKSTGDICICSHFSQIDKGEALYSSANGVIISQNFIHFYADKIAPGQFDFVNSYLPAQNSAGTPVQIAYKLAVPEKITVIPRKIIALQQGKNTLWGDGDFHRAIFNFSNNNGVGKAGAGENAEVFNGNIPGNAIGAYSHAEGENTVASWEASHAEGLKTISGNTGTHSEGVETKAKGPASHSEGVKTTAEGVASHAEGYETVAYSDYSHAEGMGTFANGLYQHVQGMFNVKDSDRYIHIVGLGADDDHRANIHTLSYLGEAWFSGDVYTGSTSGINRDEGSKKLATEEYVDTKINSTPKSDWNQNDSEAIDYIENRPFYTETLEVHNEILSRARFPGSYDVSNFVSVLNNPLIPGQKYIVTWSDTNNTSDTQYNCIARSFDNGYVMIGNAAIYEHNNGDATDTGEPFALYSIENNVELRLNLTSSNLRCQFSISAVTEETNIHKIPEEYLPDGIVSKEYVDSAISENIIGIPGEGEYSEVFNGNSSQCGAGDYSHTEGQQKEWYSGASGNFSHAEGKITIASGAGSHSQNVYTKATGTGTHAEGYKTNASNYYTHSEGSGTEANGFGAHTEGFASVANGLFSHAEGRNTISNIDYQHVQGKFNIADTKTQYREKTVQITTSLKDSFIYGNKIWIPFPQNVTLVLNTTTGLFNLQGGNQASGFQERTREELTVGSIFVEDFKKDNLSDLNEYYVVNAISGNGTNLTFELTKHYSEQINENANAHVVGNGSNELERSNAHTLDWDGNAWFAGDVYTGSTSGKNRDEGSKKLATEEAVADQINTAISNNEATEDEIMELLVSLDMFPVVTDLNGSILTDENDAILLV